MRLGEGADPLELGGGAVDVCGDARGVQVADDLVQVADDLDAVAGPLAGGLEVVAVGEEREGVVLERGEHGPETAEVVLHAGEGGGVNTFWVLLRRKRLYNQGGGLGPVFGCPRSWPP